MSKIPGTTLPGIPTDEPALWEKLQEASKEIVRCALELEQQPLPYGDRENALLQAVRAYKKLLPAASI